MNLKGKLILGAIVSVVAVVVFFSIINWVNIEGNERGVVQNWNGVKTEILQPGLVFYCPIYSKIYTYHVGVDNFIMGRKELYSGKDTLFADFDAYTITTGGSGQEQPATFSVTLQFHIDPDKLLTLHNSAKLLYAENVIKPALTRIISDQSTTMKVLDFYSGEGRVSLQRNIEKAITDEPSLHSIGLVVNRFVIDEIALDPKYVSEITGRQIATQQTLRAIEETKAAAEAAKKEEKIAEADRLKRIVAADASKQEEIKKAEAAAEQVRLSAIAAAAQVKAQAEADRFRKEQDAKGLLAQGLAQAEVLKAQRDSRYDGESGRRQAMVELQQAKTEMFKNMKINGIMPENTVMTLINSDSSKDTVLSVPATTSK